MQAGISARGRAPSSSSIYAIDALCNAEGAALGGIVFEAGENGEAPALAE